jgi:hypothetical protein
MTWRVVDTIHYSQLKPSPQDPVDEEMATYLRAVGQLLAEGHEGQWALIKKTDIVGIFHSDRAALDEGYRRFQLSGFLVQQIQTHEPVYRVHAWM